VAPVGPREYPVAIVAGMADTDPKVTDAPDAGASNQYGRGRRGKSDVIDTDTRHCNGISKFSDESFARRTTPAAPLIRPLPSTVTVTASGR
jgi:hypothetical protein